MLLGPNSNVASRFFAPDSFYPVLSCDEAKEWESSVLADEESEWGAMRRVGTKLAAEICLELAFGLKRSDLKVLVLVGKGHNGGDALLALLDLVERGCVSAVWLVLSDEFSSLKANTRKAYETFVRLMPKERLVLIERVGTDDLVWLEAVDEVLTSNRFDLSIDGFLGMSFRSPLRFYFEEVVKAINGCDRIGLRVAVDVPTGLGGDTVLVADVTVATGICKDLVGDVSHQACCGKLRYVEVGLFEERPISMRHVLSDGILDPLRVRRPVLTEKRQQGHVGIVAGSRRMSGAMAMCVRGALQSGVGLVTVFAPESVVGLCAASIPEAMWVAWPETPDGELAMEGEYLLSRYAEKVDALIVGPGVGRGRETRAMVRSLVSSWRRPIVLDADALTQDVAFALGKRRTADAIVTPHLGEFFRMLGNCSGEYVDDGVLFEFSRSSQCVTVLKGANTRIASEGGVFLNTTGNGVLARGGSGDVLSGMIGGLLARWPMSPVEVACAGTFWHGRAGDVLAYRKGQNAVRTTELLECLAPALESPLLWEI